MKKVYIPTIDPESLRPSGRWEAWFNDTWSKIHKQGLEAIERRKLNEHPTV